MFVHPGWTRFEFSPANTRRGLAEARTRYPSRRPCLDLAAWVLGPIEHVVNVRVHVSGHHSSAVVRTQLGTVVDLEAGWEAAAPALQMSVTGATTTLTASSSRLVAGSTAVASGRPPDAGDAPRAWLDAFCPPFRSTAPELAEAIDRMRAIDLLRSRVSSDPPDSSPT